MKPSGRVKDLTGETFSSLTVISYAGTNHHGTALWNCSCACGKNVTAAGRDLSSGHTGSCGCSRSAALKGKHIKHGMTGTPEYNAWRAMKARCLSKSNMAYENWGGRGISVCDEWAESFDAFYRDMGPRPSGDHSIDRIDNNGDYVPDNCRWATREEQNSNKRPASKNAVGVHGVRFNKQAKKWIAQITKDGKQIHLGRFANPLDAIAARLSAESRLYG